MCDFTPLEATMHMRELDRQATLKMEPLQLGKPRALPVVAALVALLRRLQAAAANYGDGALIAR